MALKGPRVGLFGDMLEALPAEVRQRVMAEVAQLFPPADLEEVRLAAAAGDAAVALLAWEPTRPSTQAAMCVATLGLIGSSKAKAEASPHTLAMSDPRFASRSGGPGIDLIAMTTPLKF